MRGDIKVIFIFRTIHYIRQGSVVNHRPPIKYTPEDKTDDCISVQTCGLVGANVLRIYTYGLIYTYVRARKCYNLNSP